MNSTPENPYLYPPLSADDNAPQRRVVIEGAPPEILIDAEDVRRVYLKKETAISSLWLLYCVGGIATTALGIAQLLHFLSEPLFSTWYTEDRNALAPLFRFLNLISVYLSSVSVLFGLLQTWGGVHLAQLRPTSRLTGSNIAGFWMLYFPLGTIVGISIVYLLNNSKADMIFSAYYKDIVSKTPHIRRKISVLSFAIQLALLLVYAIFQSPILFELIKVWLP